MNWMLSFCVPAALLGLCWGQNTLYEGNSLSESGYHLCIHNETRTVSYLLVHEVPDTTTKPCGGWLLWQTCTVTHYRMTYETQYKTVVQQVTRCCNGYVQVGRYCALSVNRSRELSAKPGSCPTADGFYPESEDCEWDMDCPGWQKCCQRLDHFVCTDPAGSANSRRYRLNATVTVKTDYYQLMSKEEGLLNHTRLLQAMVTGALQSEDVSVYYVSSWAVHPYRTATSLLVDFSFTLPLHNVTSRLSLLLIHIPEVSAVTVEDVDECAESTLHQCSSLTHCNNTVGSYMCTCRQGYIDADPSNPGAHCTADAVSPLPTSSRVNTTYTTQIPPGDASTGISNASEASTTASHAPPWTHPGPHNSTSSTVEAPLPTITCSPPSITSLQSANVTGTSFCVHWSSQSQTNQTYWVVLSKGSEVVHFWETNQTMMKIMGLQPGVLYNVTVTPHACTTTGLALYILVRTDAQTVDATARFTNIQFSADLQNSSSQAYKSISESITQEIYQSLSPEMRAMVDSGHLRIEIRSFSPGSVVVNFTITFATSKTQTISSVASNLLLSLINSSIYTVDTNSLMIEDFNECASGENDCSPWAICTNTWGSYTCVCLDGFVDNNPERPGRACQAVATLETTSTPTVFPMFRTSPFSQITSITDPTLTTGTTTPGGNRAVILTDETVSTRVSSTTLASNLSVLTTDAATGIPVGTSAQATTTTPTMTITTTSAPTTTITTTSAPTTTITTTSAPTTTITTTSAPTTTTPTTTITTTSTPATTTPTTTITTTSAPTTTITTTSAPTTTITTTSAPTTTTPTTTVTTTSAPTTTTPTTTETTTSAPTTTRTDATTNTTASLTSPAHATTIIADLSSTSTTDATTTAASSTATTITERAATGDATTTKPQSSETSSTTSFALRTATKAISVQCRVAATTVIVEKDFLLSNNIRESVLYLGLQGCGVNGGNSTHAELTVAWNECDTTLVRNDTYFTTSVTLFSTIDSYVSPSGTVEVPKVRLEVPIMCNYKKSLLISSASDSTGYDMIKDVIAGSGSFQVTVQLLNGTSPLPHNYSLSPQELVVVEVSVNTSSEHIKVIANKCWVTPSPNSADTYSYTFLENSCSLNPYTKVLMNGNSSKSLVSVQIFSLVNWNVIYLHCQVQICVQIGSDTCVIDCMQRLSRSSNTFGRGIGSSGPLLRSEESGKSPEQEYDSVHVVGLACLGVGLSLFFIVGFICLFYYQRNRIGHYNFSAKPKQENFTYLVFNA